MQKKLLNMLYSDSATQIIIKARQTKGQDKALSGGKTTLR